MFKNNLIKKIANFLNLKELGKRALTVIILTMTAIITVWVYAAFTEPAVGPAASDQDYAQNILGANNANNAFDSSLVTASSTGSLIERLEYIWANRTSFMANVTNLDATVSSRLAAASYVTERGTDNAALASNYTSTRAGYLDNLDATVSSRLAAASYTAERGTDNAALDSEVGGASDSASMSTTLFAGQQYIVDNIIVKMAECNSEHSIGDACGGGIKFASGLVAMPGGCTGSSFNPTCAGGSDTITKTWADSTGANEPADSVSDGESNTANLVGSSLKKNLAALYCFDMVYQGYDDWYLPAKDQLNTLYGQKATVGGFIAGYYWSSTESYTYNGWGQSFSIGDQVSYLDKTYAYYVRCVRSY